MTQLPSAICSFGAALTALLLSTGCKPVEDASGSDRSQTAGAPGSSAPAFKNLRELDVVSGKLAVELEPRGTTRQALLVNGAPVGSTAAAPQATITWDTTTSPDGIVAVEARAGEARSGRKVVVLNKGSEVFFKNGSSGKVVVPPGGYETQHLRYHWDIGAEVRRIVAVLTWDKPDFDLELAIGWGMCPRHGKQVGSAHGSVSPVIVHYTIPKGQDAQQGQWFAHVRLLNHEKVLGRETAFTVKAFQLR